MKKFWSFIIAGLLGISCIEVLHAKAEDKIEYYSNNNLYYEYKANYSFSIYDNGNVHIYISTDIDKEIYEESRHSGNLKIMPITIKDKNNILYSHYNNCNIVINNSNYHMHCLNEDGTCGVIIEYDFSPDIRVYTDQTGKIFYLKNNEKIYFTDTIIVEFAGKVYTKEIGTSANNPVISTETNLYGDINKDGFINASDAACILRYSAYLGTGGTLSLEDFIGKEDN